MEYFDLHLNPPTRSVAPQPPLCCRIFDLSLAKAAALGATTHVLLGSYINVRPAGATSILAMCLGVVNDYAQGPALSAKSSKTDASYSVVGEVDEVAVPEVQVYLHPAQQWLRVRHARRWQQRGTVGYCSPW